jgi:hypothetical protein
LQDLSFDFDEPLFEFGRLRFGLRIFTFENVYGLDKDSCSVQGDDHDLHLDCRRLTWAGGQELAEGSVSLHAQNRNGRVSFQLRASTDKTIRSTKLSIEGLPHGEIVNLRETGRQTIPPGGLVFRYPDGWRGLYTPLAVLRTESGRFMYFRSRSPAVRETLFTFVPTPAGLKVELIYEELATEMTTSVTVPTWEVGTAGTLEEVLEEQRLWLEQTYRITAWEKRSDVPSWAHEISLIAAVHCQHWTGYVFNDYERVQKSVEWLAQRIEPKRLLVFLPGWEGRYYWQYGDYRPDARLGGEAGFARLTEASRALGVRLMPMFGTDHANQRIDNFEQWGRPALISSAGGFSNGGSVDWDASRHHDHGWGVSLNPGAPTWQNRLVDQILRLVETYRFDGVFLDVSAIWRNDPRYSVFQGVRDLVQRLREGHSEILVAGEGWYDALGLATPLMQAGHTDGHQHWHDDPYSPLFDTYHRSFGHLCLGDPSGGSTGVHELGINPQTRVPLRKGVIPTVTITDRTLALAPTDVLEIIDDAKKYAELFLTGRDYLAGA